MHIGLNAVGAREPPHNVKLRAKLRAKQPKLVKTRNGSQRKKIVLKKVMNEPKQNATGIDRQKMRTLEEDIGQFTQQIATKALKKRARVIRCTGLAISCLYI